MIWQLLTVVCGSILGGEAWITLRDRARARHAKPVIPPPTPGQAKHNLGEWLARKPVDLDKRDRRGY
jgi:hypothetical protein